MITDTDQAIQWTEVSTDFPVRVVFEYAGEEFIGTYIRSEIVTPSDLDRSPFAVFLLLGRDNVLYSVSGTKLASVFEDIEEGSLVRIVYKGEVDTGRGSPMRDYQVFVARTA